MKAPGLRKVLAGTRRGTDMPCPSCDDTGFEKVGGLGPRRHDFTGPLGQKRQCFECAKGKEQMAHYADGRPAKIGDLAVRQQAWDRTETALIITAINAGANTCNASAIPLATKQGDGPFGFARID